VRRVITTLAEPVTLCAEILLSIFIDSMTSSASPATTSFPSATSSCSILPAELARTTTDSLMMSHACARRVSCGQRTGHLGDVLAFARSVSHKRLSVARLEGEHRLAKGGGVDEDAVLCGVDDVSPPETVQRYVERGVIFPFVLWTHRHVVLM
jgi:hypothetical protein